MSILSSKKFKLKNESTPKSDLLIFSVFDPLPPKGGTTENQQVKMSPLGDLGVR
jgi:hypothetical protein